MRMFGQELNQLYCPELLLVLIQLLVQAQLSKKILKLTLQLQVIQPSLLDIDKVTLDIIIYLLLSLISVFLLEGVYFYNFTTPEFNVNICQLPFWALSVYYSWKLFDKQKITFKDCFWLGVFAAIGFLSKYLSLIHI